MSALDPTDWHLSLAETLAGLRTDAVIDLVVHIGDAEPYVVRCADGRVTQVFEADPERMVSFALSPEAAGRVRAGTTNAQQLLVTGELKIGGRIDVLQAAASDLGALGESPA